MPWFYFHLRGPKGLERDEVGLELASVEAAYLGAYRAIPGMSADLIHEKANPFRYAFEIADASGRLLMELPFTEFLDRQSERPAPPSPADLFRKGRAEMERTAGLLKDLSAERAALEATLSETRRLLTASERAGHRSRGGGGRACCLRPGGPPSPVSRARAVRHVRSRPGRVTIRRPGPSAFDAGRGGKSPRAGCFREAETGGRSG
jgi:hypothetical protein